MCGVGVAPNQESKSRVPAWEDLDVGVPVVNIENSLGRGQTDMAAKIFEKLPQTWL
jgi:hypothetical protein